MIPYLIVIKAKLSGGQACPEKACNDTSKRSHMPVSKVVHSKLCARNLKIAHLFFTFLTHIQIRMHCFTKCRKTENFPDRILI